MDQQRERLIGRHNRSTGQNNCRSAIGFVAMVCVTISLVIAGLVLTGQAKTASQILSLHSGQCAQSSKVKIIAHRGSSGMRPAHSIAGYELAAEQGADYIECDLALTKDSKLVCLHDAYLSSTTNVESMHRFHDRKSTKFYKDEEMTDWWVTDFTLDELQQLRLIQEREDRDQSYNGLWTIPTFEQYLEVARTYGVKIYPETKTPEFFFDLTGVYMEELLVKEIKKSDFSEDNCIVQSFSPDSLKRVRSRDESLPLILLTKTALSDEQLDELSNDKVYGIGAEKSLVITAENNNRTGYSNLVERCHSRDLKVHIWVCRNEPEFLLWNYGMDPYKEYEDLISKGNVDGIFTDFPWSLRNYIDLTSNCDDS